MGWSTDEKTRSTFDSDSRTPLEYGYENADKVLLILTYGCHWSSGKACCAIRQDCGASAGVVDRKRWNRANGLMGGYLIADFVFPVEVG